MSIVLFDWSSSVLYFFASAQVGVAYFYYTEQYQSNTPNRGEVSNNRGRRREVSDNRGRRREVSDNRGEVSNNRGREGE